jgi:hypothetical protein
MNSGLRAILFVLVGCDIALTCASCITNASAGLAPACITLNNCCSAPGFNQSEANGCQETAQSGQSDAGCGMLLAQYQMQGECLPDSGP